MTDGGEVELAEIARSIYSSPLAVMHHPQRKQQRAGIRRELSGKMSVWNLSGRQ